MIMFSLGRRRTGAPSVIAVGALAIFVLQSAPAMAVNSRPTSPGSSGSTHEHPSIPGQTVARDLALSHVLHEAQKVKAKLRDSTYNGFDDGFKEAGWNGSKASDTVIQLRALGHGQEILAMGIKPDNGYTELFTASLDVDKQEALFRPVDNHDVEYPERFLRDLGYRNIYTKAIFTNVTA